MTDKAKRDLKDVLMLAKEIKSEAEHAIELIENVEEQLDMFQVETSFYSIERITMRAYEISRSTFDDFEEEKF